MALVSNESEAKYYREVTPDFDQYHVRVFYKEGKLRMTGTYSDPELTTMNGQFTYYYEIGTRESQGHYREGFKTGAWKRWDWKEDPKADRLYPEESPTEIAQKWRTEPAQFPGGYAGLSAYISENLVYPEEAKAQGIQGDVNVAFNIDTEGTIQDIQIVESVHYYLDKEAMRLVFEMPNWEPAIKRGVPIRAMFILPLTFRLPDNKASDQ
jgi:TonB family protein